MPETSAEANLTKQRAIEEADTFTLRVNFTSASVLPVSQGTVDQFLARLTARYPRVCPSDRSMRQQTW